LDWIKLEHLDQLQALDESSSSKYIVIFKHSTRCPISTVAKLRLKSKWSLDSDRFGFYYLDLIKFRDLSNEIEDRYQVKHESPQVIVIKNAEAIYDNSHLDISIKDLESVLV